MTSLTPEYRPAVLVLKSGSVRSDIGLLNEIAVVTDLESLAAGLRTMHRTGSTPGELLAELVALLAVPEVEA